MASSLLLPDVDLLRRAFDRHDPNPLVVNQVVSSVENRRLLLLGWVRQGLISRAQDSTEAARIARVLAPFPDLPIQQGDHGFGLPQSTPAPPARSSSLPRLCTGSWPIASTPASGVSTSAGTPCTTSAAQSLPV